MGGIIKLRSILSRSQKRTVLIIGLLTLVGMLMEMLGLGIMIPATTLLLDENLMDKYPALKPILNFLGNQTHKTLVLYGMLLLIFIYIVKVAFLAYLAWRQAVISSKLSADLSYQLFCGYIQQPYTYHLERNSAQLLRNIQIEINHFNTFSQAIITLVSELSVVGGIIFIMILVEPFGTLMVAAVLAVLGIVFYMLTTKRLLRWGGERQYHDGQINQHLMQGLGGVKEVKLLGRESYFINQFNRHNERKSTIISKQTTLSQIPRLYFELLAIIGLAGLVFAMLAQNKPINSFLPILSVFLAASFRMIPSMNRIMVSIQQIRYTQPVVDLLYEEFIAIKNLKLAALAPDNSTNMNFNDDIELKGIVFRYSTGEVDVLKDVSFKIKKGETIGFVGPSGSGKSTFVDIFLGLLTPKSGTISADNVNVHDKLREWQNLIGYVPQSIYLTDDTLRRNIAFGITDDLIDDEAVRAAVRSAQLDSFIDELPMGLDTTVGERGTRLSGGQIQRLGIARALYNNPQILVFDEATSALDTETEKGIVDAIEVMHGQKTILIVAHRLTTVAHCDRIYRVEHGVLSLKDLSIINQ